MPASTIGRLRLVAMLEGISFLVLVFIGVPLKRVWDMPLTVRVVGPMHGILFLSFVYLLFVAATEHDWPFRKSAMAFLAALLPFGTFFLDRKLAAEYPS